MRGGRRKRSSFDVDRLIAMRDIDGLTWREIGEAFNDNFATCCARYFYYKDKRRLEAMRAGEDITPRERQPRRTWSKPKKPNCAVARVRVAPVRTVASIRAKPEPAKAAVPVVPKAPAPVCRPRYFHEADADIAARIRRQGVTAGLLGDPPPGRSALDERRIAEFSHGESR